MAIYTLPEFSRLDMVSSLHKRNLMVNVSEKNMNVLLAIIESGSEGITAREISNQCDMTIYSVRHSLDKLETCKLISRIPAVSAAKIKWISGKHLISVISSLQTRKIVEREC